MARRLIHGYEGGVYLDKAVLVSGSPTVTTGASTYSFSGTYYLNLNSGKIYYSLTAADYYKIAVRVYFTSSSYTNYTCLRIQNDTTVLGSIKLDIATDGKLKVYRGDGTNLIATGTKTLAINTMYRLDIYYKPATGATGQFFVRINGIEDIAQVDVATSNSSGQVNRLYLGTGGAMLVDDIVADDSSYVGYGTIINNSRIQGIVGDGTGNSAQFTKFPNTGDNYEKVDEVPYSDADYNYTNTVDHLDLFSMSNLSEVIHTIQDIKCVDLIARAKLEGEATPTEMALAVRTGSTNYAGSDQVVTQDEWNFYHQLWETNPDTSSAWVKAEINALEGGYKARS